MMPAKGTSKKRGSDEDVPELDNKVCDDEAFDQDFSSDIQSIISALHQIREKAQKDGQKKNEEIIRSVASDVRNMMEDAKTKLEKERLTIVKALSKCTKECEALLKNESTKFHGTYEKFCKDKTAYLQALKDIYSKFEDEKEKLFVRYEQQRKKEKAMLSDLEKACAGKVTAAEDSLKKKRQDDKSFSLLRKSLGSFLDCPSDEELEPDN